MIPQRQSSDLAAESFLVLRTAFFGERAEPQFYQLRDKRNTQDDPFDVYVHQLLEERLPADTKCLKAPGRNTAKVALSAQLVGMQQIGDSLPSAYFVRSYIASEGVSS